MTIAQELTFLNATKTAIATAKGSWPCWHTRHPTTPLSFF